MPVHELLSILLNDHQRLSELAASQSCNIYCLLQTPYIQFIANLIINFRTRDIVMLECRHVSLNLCSHAVSPDLVVEAIAEVLRRNKWQKAAFVGHSYGTFVLSRMVQLHRGSVECMVRQQRHQLLLACMCDCCCSWPCAFAAPAGHDIPGPPWTWPAMLSLSHY